MPSSLMIWTVSCFDSISRLKGERVEGSGGILSPGDQPKWSMALSSSSVFTSAVNVMIKPGVNGIVLFNEEIPAVSISAAASSSIDVVPVITVVGSGDPHVSQSRLMGWMKSSYNKNGMGVLV